MKWWHGFQWGLLMISVMSLLALFAERQRIQHVQQIDKSSALIAVKKRRLKVDVYGGSITLGRGLEDECPEDSIKNRYTTYLQRHLPEAEVRNKAISAAGVESWLNCGMEPTDIIISEFRLNERNQSRLQEWYKASHAAGQHTVVLDLWSWLKPPTRRESATTSALKQVFPRYTNQSFSILSLEKQELSNWKEYVAEFFNYTGHANEIGKECYENVNESSKFATRAMEACRQKYAHQMQHGRSKYHEHVGEALVDHIRKVVLEQISTDASATPPKPSKGTGTTLCIGQWGPARNSYASWNATVVYNNGFQISNPFTDRTDKTTLNTNDTASTITLDCPMSNSFMKVGYIAHSDEEEIGTFILNGEAVRTKWITTQPHIRVRRYTDAFKAPIHVSIQRPLPPGAYIELTDVVCFVDD